MPASSMMMMGMMGVVSSNYWELVGIGFTKITSITREVLHE